jgi:teichuronic acid exporter
VSGSLKNVDVAPTDGVAHGLRWLGSARLFTQIITWVLTAVTVRFLRPEDYGLIATAGLFTTFATLLIDGGMSGVLISRRDMPVEQEGAAATAMFLLAVVLGTLIFVAAPLGSNYFRSPSLTRVLQVSAFYLPLAALTVVPLALQTKEMRFRQIAVISSLTSLVQGVSTLGMAYLGMGYWALIIGVLIGAGLRTCLLWTTLGRSLVPNFRLSALKSILHSSGHLTGQQLTYYSVTNFDIFLISRFGGAGVVGPYSLAKTLSHTALDQIAGIVNQISLPAFAAQPDANLQLRGLIKIISLGSTILFPLFWLMGALSRVGLPLVFGSRWAAVVVPFCAFCVILPLRSVYTFLDSSVVGTGRTSTTFRNMLLWAAVMMPLLVIGVRLRSFESAAYGAAMAWLIGFPIVFLAAIRRIAKSFGARVRDLLQPMWIPASCALISCIAVQAVHLLLSSKFSAVILLGCETLAGGIVYLIAIRQFGRGQYGQVIAMLSRLFPFLRSVA